MRYILPRASFIPKGATKVQPKNSDAVAYLYLSGPGHSPIADMRGSNPRYHEDARAIAALPALLAAAEKAAHWFRHHSGADTRAETLDAYSALTHALMAATLPTESRNP